MSTLRNIPTHTPAPDDTAKFAHELSNLLDGSLRHLSLAMAELENMTAEHSSDDTTHRLQASSEAMRQMAKLLQRFMDAGRSANAALLKGIESTLSEALAYAMRSVEPSAQQAQITLHGDLGPLSDLPAGPLYPVLINALKNAIEAIGEHGRIDVHGSLNGDTATFTVTDNGPGIGDNVPLDANGQVMRGFTSKPTGHGIGLAASREAVESIGGTLTLNNHEMHGATLTVRWNVKTMSNDSERIEHE